MKDITNNLSLILSTLSVNTYVKMVRFDNFSPE